LVLESKRELLAAWNLIAAPGATHLRPKIGALICARNQRTMGGGMNKPDIFRELNLVGIALDNEKVKDGTSGPLKKLIDGADLVFAVWQTMPGDFDYAVIKFCERLDEPLPDGETLEGVLTAFFVEDLEMALAVKRELCPGLH
jgi:hypothetical protein